MFLQIDAKVVSPPHEGRSRTQHTSIAIGNALVYTFIDQTTFALQMPFQVYA